MNLQRTSLLNGMAVILKVASAMLLNKILAMFVGPAGFAIIGQFQNAVSIAVNLAGGLLANGVTKATAEHYADSARQHAVWSTALRLSLYACMVAAVFLLAGRDWLAEWLLRQPGYGSVFVWLACGLPAMALNTVLLAVVNGKKEVWVHVTASMIGSVLSILVTGVLAWRFGLYGTLVALIINPALVLLTTAAVVTRRAWFKPASLWRPCDPASVRDLWGFGLMGLTSALAVPITFMLIRDHVTTVLGASAAGYWQASWKISEIYLMLVTTTLSLYYLPRLAEIRYADELVREIKNVYRLVLPLVALGAACIFLLRDFIVGVLFTAAFAPMRDLFAWQLTGDVIKIGAWILAYVMLGRAMVRVFVVTEIVFAASFVGLSWWLVGQYGLKGVPLAYAINYAAYWLTMAAVVRQEMRSMPAHAVTVGHQ